MHNNKVITFLRWLNEFKDAFLVECCMTLLMLGFVAGTVDVLGAQFGLSSQPWFNASWSIVQAVSIDGLFFAVWSRFRETPFVPGTKKLKVWYGTIGLFLSLVAVLVNGLVSYQSTSHIPSAVQAMAALGISQQTFSWTRSILVVVVAVLVATLPKEVQEKVQVDTIDVQEVVPLVLCDEQPVEVECRSITHLDSATINTDEVQEEVQDDVPSGTDGTTTRERIRPCIEIGMKYNDIAEQLGLSISTVKLHGAAIRKEMRMTDPLPIIE